MTRALRLVPAAISIIFLYFHGADPLYNTIMALTTTAGMAGMMVRYERDIVKVREAQYRARRPYPSHRKLPNRPKSENLPST